MRMNPIYTCFFTRGTIYEAEAARLKKSLDRFELEHDLTAIDPIGDWVAASRYTARHICNMLAKYPDRPVVQLDADAVVMQKPILFDLLEVDVAAHWRRGLELLNGTVYFGPTPAARKVAARYLELIEADLGCTNEQIKLAQAAKELDGQFKFYSIPASYCFIPDIMKNDLVGGEEPVICHMQASRTAKHVGGEAEANRKKWIEGMER